MKLTWHSSPNNIDPGPRFKSSRKASEEQPLEQTELKIPGTSSEDAVQKFSNGKFNHHSHSRVVQNKKGSHNSQGIMI